MHVYYYEALSKKQAYSAFEKQDITKKPKKTKVKTLSFNSAPSKTVLDVLVKR